MTIVLDLVIAGVLSAIGVAIARREADRVKDRWVAKVLIASLVMHLVMVPVHIWVVNKFYQGVNDAKTYEGYAALLAPGFRHLDFSLAPAGLPHIVNFGSVAIVTAVIFALIGANQAGAFLVFAFLAWVGVLFFFRAFLITFGGAGRRRYGYLVFLWPMLAFWTAAVGKEALMNFLLGMAAFGAARVLREQRGGWAMLIVSSVGGFFIRPNEVVLMAASMVIAVMARPSQPGSKFTGARRMVGLVTVGVVVLIGVILTLQLPTFKGHFSLSTISQNNQGTGAGFGSSVVGYSANPIKYPIDVYTVLFDPLPITAHGTAQLVNSIINTGLLGLIIASRRQLRYLLRASLARPYVLMCLVFTGIYCYLVAAYGNLGLIAREDTILMPLLFLLVCIPLSGRARRPYEWELPWSTQRAMRKSAALRRVLAPTVTPTDRPLGRVGARPSVTA